MKRPSLFLVGVLSCIALSGCLGGSYQAEVGLRCDSRTLRNKTECRSHVFCGWGQNERSGAYYNYSNGQGYTPKAGELCQPFLRRLTPASAKRSG